MKKRKQLKASKILLALSDIQNLVLWPPLIERLLLEGGELHLRALVTIPEGISLSEGAVQARQSREALDALTAQFTLAHDEHRVYVDYRPMTHVLAEVISSPVDQMIIQWAGPTELTGGLPTDQLLESVPCDLVLLHDRPTQQAGPVLLSLRGGPNLTLGLQMAHALAGQSPITLFHAAEAGQPAGGLEVVMLADRGITRAVTAFTDIAGGVVREAAGHGAIVLGAGLNRPTGRATTTIVEQIHRRTDLPIALVRAADPEPFAFHAPALISTDEPNLSTRVDRWFAESTFHCAEFADREVLLALKEKQGLTISVGLPALNEEKTVGRVIRRLKKALMDDVPLLDELVLIDSNSTDRTAEIAESLGVPVHRHPDILPEEGSFRGKGEALWKSLHILSGDIIAWVDTDISNIHPRFIYGLIGPLLKSSRFQYVKGFYRRPLKVGDELQAVGGGRVTELVARPLFNLFYPELSGIIQPLSGEYAGRRAALEQMPFFTGYGVETGLLIDLHERFGLDAIAQTDLEVRVHHNQPLVSLSRMAFAIQQVFLARLENRYGVQLLDQANRSLKMVIQEPERFALEIEEIGDHERPPMLTIPAYRARHPRPA